MDIYGIKMSVAKIESEGFLGRKKKTSWYQNTNVYPILANSEEEAMEKFKSTYVYKHACTSNALGWEFENENYEDISIGIVSVNKFTINALKKDLSADDFMLYCRDRLGLKETVKTVLLD